MHSICSLPTQKCIKFQPRAQKGILVGYSTSTKGYKIWIPAENRIIETKHVKFDESKLDIEKQGHRIVAKSDDEDSHPIPKTIREPIMSKRDLPFEVTLKRYKVARKMGARHEMEDKNSRTHKNSRWQNSQKH